MKKTFIALLVLAGVGYAAPLNEDDWTWVSDSANDGVFEFKEQTLVIKDNSNGMRLGYKTPQTPMVNGSGLSITFQFDTEKFLGDVGTALSIYLYGKDKEFHTVTVFNQKNYDSTKPFMIYESYTSDSIPIEHIYDADISTGLTRITVNYTVRDNMLYWNYQIDGITNKVSDDILADLTLDTTLNWRPAFGLSDTQTNEYTVTDVTFKSVPEPTTAALSLLALAGLAARRRR